jgi:hypothetical protein
LQVTFFSFSESGETAERPSKILCGYGAKW